MQSILNRVVSPQHPALKLIYPDWDLVCYSFTLTEVYARHICLVKVCTIRFRFYYEYIYYNNFLSVRGYFCHKCPR